MYDRTWRMVESKKAFVLAGSFYNQRGGYNQESGGNDMESITVGGLTFRWTKNTLLITTPTGQHLLNGRAAADLLTFLDANRDAIFTVDQVGEVPDWAQSQVSG